MTTIELRLLEWLNDCDKRGAFALACHGQELEAAHKLELEGFARWCGTSWGSSFYQITPAGKDQFS